MQQKKPPVLKELCWK